jgi:biopolymer transport protein ExbD
MPFDPSQPAENSPLSSAVIRDQLTSLNDLISGKPSNAEVSNAISQALQGTSNNSNAVGQMSISADGSYNPTQLQQVMDKLDELILALRR